MSEVIREYLASRVESMPESMEEGVVDTVIYAIGATRKRIQKQTAQALRKSIKEKTDKGMTLDEAIMSLCK